ncbi:HD domain-containing phosphohydrolase [Romboutsia sp.]|uniref:HD domain-containing phosphohydrolase n=1 Tax=Romboutsia sp. TaxID=1965302 RepID=UPI003F403A1D
MIDIIRVTLKSLPFPLWIKDLSLTNVFVNEAYANIYNKKVEDFIGRKYEDSFKKEIVDQYNSNCKFVMKTGESKIVTAIVNKVYLECTIFPIKEDDNNIIAIAGIILNKQDLKLKDEQIKDQSIILKAIIDALPGVIFYKNKKYEYVYCNKECSDFYKERGIDNIIGKNDFDINQNKKQCKKFIQDDKYIITKKESIHNETSFKDKNGKVGYREVIKSPAIDEYGKVRGIVGFSRDITSKIKGRERLKYLSYTDILTGLNNRTYFEEQMERYNKEDMQVGVIMGDANGLKIINDTFGHEEGDKLLKNIANIIKLVCNDKGDVCRIGGDEFVILVPNANENECESIIKEILSKCKRYKHNLIKMSIALGYSIKKNKEIDIYQTLKEAEDIVYRKKLLQEKSIRSSIMYSLKTGLQTKSMETEEHTERMIKNATVIGKNLNLSMGEMDELILVTTLHDIGKIGISEEVLLKPGKLTDEEYEIIKTHTEKGFRIVQASSELSNVARGVLTHHERWDGTGYPLGIRGEDIPKTARIVAVIDAYDVMTNDRVYKKAMTKEEAIFELKRCSGSQFDPEIVKVFIESVQRD